MSEKLYNFAEASKIMESKGLGNNNRKDATNFRQFTENGSSLHINSANLKRFTLFSTDGDYTSLLHQVKLDNKAYIEMSIENKDEVKSLLDQVVEFKEVFVFIRNGNKVLHAGSAEKYIPNIVIAYSNDNFEYMLDVLAKNPDNCR